MTSYTEDEKRRKLTGEQIEFIITKRELGWSHQSIARHLGVTAGAVHYQCLRHGAVSPNQGRTIGARGPQVFRAKDGRIQRRFTPAEDSRMLELSQAGLGYTAIARAMNRPRTSIRMRLLTLAMREDLPVHDQAA